MSFFAIASLPFFIGVCGVVSSVLCELSGSYRWSFQSDLSVKQQLLHNLEVYPGHLPLLHSLLCHNFIPHQPTETEHQSTHKLP